MTGVSAVLIELVAWVPTVVPALTDRVSTTFPHVFFLFPWCVIDTPTGVETRNVSGTYGKHLVRFSVFHTSQANVDTIVDSLISAMDTAAFSVNHFAGIRSRSPVLRDPDHPALYRRDFDMETHVINVR